jgi:hypothetical protein
LAEQAVSVLVRAALPRAAWVAEIDLLARHDGVVVFGPSRGRDPRSANDAAAVAAAAPWRSAPALPLGGQPVRQPEQHQMVAVVLHLASTTARSRGSTASLAGGARLEDLALPWTGMAARASCAAHGRRCSQQSRTVPRAHHRRGTDTDVGVVIWRVIGKVDRQCLRRLPPAGRLAGRGRRAGAASSEASTVGCRPRRPPTASRSRRSAELICPSAQAAAASAPTYCWCASVTCWRESPHSWAMARRASASSSVMRRSSRARSNTSR